MKALYIGSTEPTSCAIFYPEALKELGWDVRVFDPRYFSSHGLLGKLTLKLTGTLPQSRIEKSDNQLLEIARQEEFDLILVISENFLSASTLQELKTIQKKKSPAFLYHSHDNNFSHGILKPPGFWENLSCYDFVFTTKSQNIEPYRKQGVKHPVYIPSAYSPRAHLPFPNEKSHFSTRPLSVTFIGTYDKSRDPAFDDFDWEPLRIWGNNWKRSRHYKEHVDHIIPKAIYGEEYADVTSHSKISLGLLREEAADRHTQRTFEIPACGSLQLAPRNEEILSFFEEGKEIACFGSFEEMRDKVNYYLRNETERQRLARAGYERVTSGKHTYRDRVETMLKTAGRK